MSVLRLPIIIVQKMYFFFCENLFRSFINLYSFFFFICKLDEVTILARFYLVTIFRGFSLNRGDVATHFVMFTLLLDSVTIVATQHGFATDIFLCGSFLPAILSSPTLGKSSHYHPLYVHSQFLDICSHPIFNPFT